MCISYTDYVRSLADTNGDGSVSETEALLLTFDVVEAPDESYGTVARFDIDRDGVVDNDDITTFLTILDTLVS